jgi:small subunit ribosomal protein S1
VGDELEGAVTKVVAFGAFVEILEGVEGLVHISELAGHHVENPREVVAPGQEVKVKILEVDSERRRLSLSVKRVEGQELPLRSLEGDAGDLDDMPELELSEDVFTEPSAAPEAEEEIPAEVEAPEAPEPEDAAPDATEAEPEPEAPAEAPAEPEAEAPAEPEAEAPAEPEEDAEKTE